MKKKASEKTGRAPQIRGKNFRLVIPNLTQYSLSNFDQISQLKNEVLLFLQQKQKSRNLRYYSIAVQSHQNDVPHLDILLVYDKSVLSSLNRFDKLIKHGNLTKYKELNTAILEYNFKQDKHPLSNLPPDTSQILDVQLLKKDPYLYLQKQMLKDPLHFKFQQYVRQHNLDPHINQWSSMKTKIKDMQIAAANLSLKSKPGFKLISTEVIETQLNSQQKELYFGQWDGYRRIVSYLNQLVTLGYKRPMKTLNLLITGPSSIGKSALIWNQYPLSWQNPLSRYCAVYPMGMKNWFPQYESEVYKLIYWNEAKLTSYAYDTILQVLDGSPVMLPSKGSSHKKIDNPLIIMTSNMTLQQMIDQKFSYNKKYLRMARKTLEVRIQNVVVPENYDLFLLQKLLVPL